MQIGNPADLSLHAGIAAKVHQRQKLERVCRYIALDGRRVDGTGPGRLAGGDEPDPRLHGAQPGALYHRPGADLDPVLETAERDLQVLKDMGLTLMATLETHVHADHLTSARRLKQRTECQIACPRMLDLPCADIGLQEGEPFRVGSVTLHPLFTPGHTDHHHAYLIDTPVQKLLFTGDALLIEACGRTDFQSGSATDLYNSIHNKLFSLPGETLVYPGHDYEQRFVSSIAQEKARNPRLGGGRSKEDFVALMDGLDLPYPRKIDFAVPGNEDCGQCPANIPEQFRGPCAASDQG